MSADEPHKMAEEALARLGRDERDADAWRMLGDARSLSGDWDGAGQCWQAALQLGGQGSGWAVGAGQRALAAAQFAAAEQVLSAHLTVGPVTEAAAHVLATALRAQGKSDEAIAFLQAATAEIPRGANIRSQLCGLLAEQGRMTEALIYIEQALLLAPGWPSGLNNRANVRLALGDAAGCLADLEQAIAAMGPGGERASMQMAQATALLSLGRLKDGWAAYAARRDPAYGGYIRFDIDRPMWTAGQPLEGLRLLVVAEQGLGDEVMFMTLIPDLIAALGPRGHLTLAADVRLLGLVQRSFPEATAAYHHTRRDETGLVRRTVPQADLDRIDAWVPLGDLLAALRPTVESFAGPPGFLTPDPVRVAAMTAMLDQLPPGRRIGLAWKSSGPLRARSRYYPPFEDWKALFDLPDVQVVSLQYGDTDAEAALVQDAWGKTLWRVPALDLRDDLEGLAALAAALDGVVGPMNASMALAGAAGAPSAMLMVRESWTRLGADGLPWYPQAVAASAREPGDWPWAIASALQRLKT